MRIQSAQPEPSLQQTLTPYIQNIKQQLEYILRPTNGQNSNKLYRTLGCNWGGVETSMGGSINVSNEKIDCLSRNIIFIRVINGHRRQKPLLHNRLNLLFCHMNFKGLIPGLKFYENTTCSSLLEQYFLVKCNKTD